MNLQKLTLALMLTLMFTQGCQSSPSFTSQRFIDHGDGTISDKVSGLMWMRCSVGQTWSGSNCEGEPIKVNWKDAAKVTQNFSFVGKQDWRLPTIDELSSIVFCSTGRTEMARPAGRFQRTTDGRCEAEQYQTPTVNNAIFPNTPASWFWSASPYIHHDRDAWGLNFNEGNVSWGVKGNESHVRLVRDPSPKPKK